MLRARLKQAVRATLLSSAGLPLMFLYGGLASCLMYHRIGSRSGRGFDPNRELYVAEEAFDEQMRYLAREYECLSIGDAVSLLRENKLPRRSVIVTFDDGYRDNLLALPILRHYGVPATIYVTTGAVDRTRTLWWDEQQEILARLPELDGDERRTSAFSELNRQFKALPPAQQDEVMEQLRERASNAGLAPPWFSEDTMLTWDEVIALDREPLITIGAHTVDHHVLRQLPLDELTRQLRESRQTLEERLGHPVEHFAYPFGGPEHADEREFRAAEAVGFASAVTTRPGHWRASSRHTLHALPRIAIDYSDTMEDFRWKVTGLANAVHRPWSW